MAFTTAMAAFCRKLKEVGDNEWVMAAGEAQILKTVLSATVVTGLLDIKAYTVTPVTMLNSTQMYYASKLGSATAITGTLKLYTNAVSQQLHWVAWGTKTV